MTSAARGEWRQAFGLLLAPRMRRVVVLGAMLSLALLTLFYALVLMAESGQPPEDRLFPLGPGERLRLSDLLSGVSLLYLIGVSILMMVPVASVFSWLFLDDVADAADRLDAGLPPARRMTRWDAFVANVNYLGLLSGLNILALIHVYPLIGVWTPAVFWGLNGVLLGKEYLQLVLCRRMPPDAARRLWRRNFWRASVAGTGFAVLLTVPVVNVLAPVAGALVFTRLGNRLFRDAPVSRPAG